jgi:hypothetical protein
MKRCPKCKTTKPLVEFNKCTNRNGSSYCRSCNSQNLKKHYKDNPDLNAKKKKLKLEKIRIFLLEYKRKHPCIICGERIPICLDFHHIDGDTKDMGNKHSMNGFSTFKRLKEEIAKCVMLCANDHRKVHVGMINIDKYNSE